MKKDKEIECCRFWIYFAGKPKLPSINNIKNTPEHVVPEKFCTAQEWKEKSTK